MRAFLPRTPTGNDAEARFHQATHEQVHGPAGVLRSSSTVRVSETTHGTFLHVKPQKVQPSQSGEFKMFQITEIPVPDEGDDFFDYVIAREWDGVTLGSVDVRIAKHPYWRPSVVKISVGLITYYFQYDDDNSRTVVTGPDSDDPPDFTIDPTYQQLIMPYEVDTYSPANGGHLGTLFAGKPSNGTGVDGADWIDLTQRVWARYTPGA